MSDENAEQAEDNYDGFAVATLFGRTYLEKCFYPLSRPTHLVRIPQKPV